MNVLELKSVFKSFQINEMLLTVFENFSLSLQKGDFLTILGPSGCGKSTLIRSICCFEKIDKGEIFIENKAVKKPGPDRIMVFQDFNQLFNWKTVFENITYPLILNNKYDSRKEIREKARYYLDMVHLSEFKDIYPNQLSGGMKQRVAIARALALQPKILLMDEPFGALDAQTRSILQKELINIWEETNITIIFITHNIQESILLGNKIIVLSKMPARIKLFVKNDLDFPRMPENDDFVFLWKKLYENLDIKRF